MRSYLFPPRSNKAGYTPLHYAAAARHADCFQTLVFRGASITKAVGSSVGATAPELFPEGMLRVRETLAHKEQEVRAAIRAGHLFSSGSSSCTAFHTPLRSATAAATSALAETPSPSRRTRITDSRGSAQSGTGTDDTESDMESDDEVSTNGDGYTSDDPAVERHQRWPRHRHWPPQHQPCCVCLAALTHPFKDSLRIRLVVAPNPQAGGSSRDVQRVVARSDSRCGCSAPEDAHGGVISEVPGPLRRAYRQPGRVRRADISRRRI